MMQIGASFQTTSLAMVRPVGNDGTAEARSQGPTATVGRGGHGHAHGHQDHMRGGEGKDEARLQGRLQRLQAMLQRLTEQNPDAQGASYAAIVMGGQGAVAVAGSVAGGAAGDSLAIQAQAISDVTTSARDDRVTLQGTRVSGVYTGGGSDAVAIVASFVSGIHTDAVGPLVAAPVPEPTAAMDTGGAAAPAPVVVGNDALSVAAYLINDIATGGGDDALALMGRVVAHVDAGEGQDAVAVRAGVVTGINGGAGDDAIAVDAKVGVAGIGAAAAWFGVATDPVVATVGAAARAYADVDGGAGNDVITLRTASVLAVAGGVGDDTINATGGTVSLVYGAGDGQDRVNVSAGAQVVLQIAPDVAGYTVEFGQDSMTVRMGEGSVTFTGIGAGTVGITQGGGMALITQPTASPLNRTI